MRRAHVQPREELLLDQDPKDRSLRCTARYVLRIPTYVFLVVASALSYSFFSGAFLNLSDAALVSRAAA